MLKKRKIEYKYLEETCYWKWKRILFNFYDFFFYFRLWFHVKRFAIYSLGMSISPLLILSITSWGAMPRMRKIPLLVKHFKKIYWNGRSNWFCQTIGKLKSFFKIRRKLQHHMNLVRKQRTLSQIFYNNFLLKYQIWIILKV